MTLIIDAFIIINSGFLAIVFCILVTCVFVFPASAVGPAVDPKDQTTKTKPCFGVDYYFEVTSQSERVACTGSLADFAILGANSRFMYSVAYGNYQNQDQTHTAGFILIFDEKYNVVQIIKQYSNEEYFGDIISMNVGKDGRFFMVEYDNNSYYCSCGNR